MEKNRAIQSQLHSVIINQDEIPDQAEINKQIFFYQSLFSSKVQDQINEIEAYLVNILLPKLSNEQNLCCEGSISEDEVFKSLNLWKIINHLEMIDFRKNSMNASGMKSKDLFSVCS